MWVIKTAIFKEKHLSDRKVHHANGFSPCVPNKQRFYAKMYTQRQ